MRIVPILAGLAAIPIAGFGQAPDPLDGSAAIPATGGAQTPDPLDVNGKLRLHAEAAFSPLAIVGAAAYAGVLQDANAPKEWGQGGRAYGERLASAVAGSGIHSALAFGLDTAMHQDPRYFRSGRGGFFRRAGYAVRETIMTRTDTGGETVSTWRLGSAYGAAFLSNLWYPDRLDTARLGWIQGSITVGLGLVGNLGAEFWPDVKRKVLHKK